MQQLWKLISPFWRSEEKYKPFGLLFLVIGLTLAYVYSSVLINQWNTGFYNALQELNKEVFIAECGHFLGLVVLLISVLLANFYVFSLLKFKWRKWLTEHY